MSIFVVRAVKGLENEESRVIRLRRREKIEMRQIKLKGQKRDFGHTTAKSC